MNEVEARLLSKMTSVSKGTLGIRTSKRNAVVRTVCTRMQVAATNCVKNRKVNLISFVQVIGA